MRAAAMAAGLMALALAGCETAPAPTPQTSTQAAAPAPQGQAAAPAPALSLPAPTPGAAPSTAQPVPVLPEQVPSVFMAVQPGQGGVHSIVFAIDQAKDGNPSDDNAIRLTPEGGKCNPQEMKRFTFPPDYARRPVFGVEEARRGVAAGDLPKFLAMAVTSEMLRLGLAAEPQATQPQNVCTRKLWEQLVLAQTQRGAAPGQ